MGSSWKALMELSHRANILFHPAKRSVLPKSSTLINVLIDSGFVSFSSSRTSTDNSAIENDKPPQLDRDATLLEKFRLRKLKGSSKITQKSSSTTTTKKGSENGLLSGGETITVMSGFMELGLCKEVVEAVEEMGFFIPSELHCVGIPAILEGKNVVLGSLYEDQRALAYLLPIIQNLKSDRERYDVRSKHPRALVVCPTKELADEVFQMAKFISNYGRLKSVRDNGGVQLELQEGGSDVSIGMLIGTPDEVSELIEVGNVVSDEIKYLVLDELDTMFDLSFGPSIKKILSSIQHSTSRHCNQKCQSVLVSSMVIKMLHERHSSLVESLKRDDAGEIASILLEIDEDEAYCLMESPDTLKSKVSNAIESLHLSAQKSGKIISACLTP